MPITWGMVLLLGNKRFDRKNKISFAFLMLSVFGVCLIDFCVAGVAERYVCDVLGTLALIGGLSILRFLSESSENNGGMPLAKPVLFVCICTYICAICLTFSNYRNFILAYCPDKYIDIVNTFTLY